MGCALSLGICRQQMPRSACTSAQSDQGLHCPQTESLDTKECITPCPAEPGYTLPLQTV